MKAYIVIYEGNSSRFKGFREKITAPSARKAVEEIYNKFLPHNYFPQENGTIKDCDGDTIAESKYPYIKYDGGYFSAKELIN